MAFIQAMLKAIGKVWSFASKMAMIIAFAMFVIFILTVAMPDNVARAIDITKCWMTEVGIVGSG